MLSITVKIGWKLAAVIGATVVGSYLAKRMDSTAAEQVSIHTIDAFRDAVIAKYGKH